MVFIEGMKATFSMGRAENGVHQGNGGQRNQSKRSWRPSLVALIS
ncbi:MULTISPECIES: hypothetical protein [Niallia]|nr:hypothetical protein [Niallia circulans]